MDGCRNIRIALARHEDGARESVACRGTKAGYSIDAISERSFAPADRCGIRYNFSSNNRGSSMSWNIKCGHWTAIFWKRVAGRGPTNQSRVRSLPEYLRRAPGGDRGGGGPMQALFNLS